jgi:hypothetical protein
MNIFGGGSFNGFFEVTGARKFSHRYYTDAPQMLHRILYSIDNQFSV